MTIKVQHIEAKAPEGTEPMLDHHVSKNLLILLLQEAVIAAGGTVTISTKRRGAIEIWKIRGTDNLLLRARRL